jgi:CDP-6-deoxy-D-xylo-4-hexulose-3-dehydrase
MSFYPLASSTWGGEEEKALQGVISSGNFTMGQQVKDFEAQFAKHFGAKYSVMFNSGSSANLALLAALRFDKSTKLPIGSNIIVPAVSWSTTYYPVNQLGYILNFVDIDIDTLNFDSTKVRAAINSNTSAILAVNLLGNPCELQLLKDIATENNLILIEDNCESMGAMLDARHSGTFGLAGTYSTFFSHHISTMEGGLVTTDSESLMHTLKSIRAHGWTRDLPDKNFVHDKSGDDWDDLYRFVLPGYNLRPLEMEAALGIQQLNKLDSFVMQRRANAKYLDSISLNLQNYRFQKENGQSSWFGFSIVLKGHLRGMRRQLIDQLFQNGIETRPIVTGNFTVNPVMQHMEYLPLPELPNSQEIHENGFFVGNHHYPIFTQLDKLVEVLAKFEDDHE